MYTNPNYFVQLWVESLQKNVTEGEVKRRHKVKKVCELSRLYADRALC